MITYEEAKEKVQSDAQSCVTDRDRLRVAFRALRSIGYITRMRYGCCGSCANYEVGQSMKIKLKTDDLDALPFAQKKAVHWNRQSDSAFAGDGNLETVLHISWGGELVEIQGMLAHAGLRVLGGDTQDITVQVYPKPNAPHRFMGEGTYALPNQFCGVCSKAEDEHPRAQWWRGRRVA